MAAPDRAPRKTAAQMDINVASGVPSPGANSYQVARQSSGLNPGNVPQTKGGSSGAVNGSNAYHRNPAGVTPSSFPDTKASK